MNDQTVSVSNKVRNLGVQMDSNLLMDQQISQIRQSCFFELRKISQLRPYLSKEVTNKLVCSFVLSRLDYCNSLLAGLPECKLKRLQLVQNHAARLVTKSRIRDHISPILHDLHWLPVQKRINYKISTIAYQCLHDPLYPEYLRDCVTPYVPSRSLRSSQQNLLVKPKIKISYGERTLMYQSALVWNSLPENIKSAESLPSFKKKLKTFLFSAP